MRLPFASLATTVSLLLVYAACGGDGDTPPVTSITNSAGAAGTAGGNVAGAGAGGTGGSTTGKTPAELLNEFVNLLCADTLLGTQQSLIFQSTQQCRDRLRPDFETSYATPGVKRDLGDLVSCTRYLAASKSFSLADIPACNSGTFLPAGSPCVSDAQCSVQARCDIAPGELCGRCSRDETPKRVTAATGKRFCFASDECGAEFVCNQAPTDRADIEALQKREDDDNAKGDSCLTSCSTSLGIPKKCFASPSVSGCSDEQDTSITQCFVACAPLHPQEGVCMQKPAEKQACDPKGPPCAFPSTCVDKVCRAIPAAQLDLTFTQKENEPCGGTKRCSDNLFCSDKNVCAKIPAPPPHLADGAACKADGPSCTFPARCIKNVCTVPAANACPAK